MSKDNLINIENIESEMYQSETHLLRAGKLYIKAIREFFEKNKGFAGFELYVNNHEFNDGDETSFSVSFDFIELEFDSEPSSPKEKRARDSVRGDLISLLSCAPDTLLQKVFDGYNGTLTINVEFLETILEDLK